MALLNYTTSIDAFKTIAEIQQLLVKVGASAVLSEYDGSGNIVALSFTIALPSPNAADKRQEISFRLPTDWRPVRETLEVQKRQNSRIKATEDQARRVVWRITKDWVEAQLAIIETHMVTTAQVFLPYAVTNTGQSVYEYIGSHTSLLLGSGTD